MDLSHPTTLLVPAGIAALIGWRLYRRVKRMVGRQRLTSIRPWVTLCLFPLLVAFLLLASLSHPVAALGLVGGVAVGAGLGLYGLHRTKFEQTPQGLFYTPNARLGIALSLLLVARISYRVAQIYFVPGAMQEGSAAFARSPLTLVIFGTLAGYYIAYAIGLLRWKRRVSSATPPTTSEQEAVKSDRRA
jgi:hypothetical protein